MSFFACCFRRRTRRSDSHQMLREPPEISWENSLGAPNGVPFDDATKELLRACLDVKMPTPTTLTEIIKRSEGFPVPFPVNTVRCCALRDRGIGMDTLELNANSVYPLIHEAMLPVIAGWLKYKRVHGSAVERAMYKDMALVPFVQRLVEKRAMQFYGADDRYCLIDGKSGSGGWEHVGTEREKEPLVLSSCLSYDEMKLSATIIISSHTEFINDGSRENRGVVCDDPDSIQPRGVIMGVVGTRFEKPRVMEYQDILITHLQNNMDNGYGPAVEGTTEEKRGLRCVWSRFYGEDYHPLYDEAMRRVKSKENRRYITLTGQIIFDAENYMKRTLMSVEMTLLEANTRAEKQNTTAFLHVVGIGLGVWKIIHDQEIYFLKTFEIALRKMNKKLKYVSDIMFSYFRQQKCGGAGNGDYLGDIRIHFALREPHTKLFRSSDANKLLIVTYAADGNSFPGNEFWGNYLTASGDPAAACSTQISEIHNPRINPRLCGASLHVASPEHGIVHIGDYAKLHLTPLGTDEQPRRPSRSPRNQRSRSADVDCLKKYMERRVEVRRHTEAGETSRWIPLSKSSVRSYLPTKDHTFTYNKALAGARYSVDTACIGDKEVHGYSNPAAERSPRRRTFDVVDARDPGNVGNVGNAGKVKWLPIMSRNSSQRSDSLYPPGEEEIAYRAANKAVTAASRQTTGRSMSADVSYFRRDSTSRWNERCVNFADHSRLISYRWMPETGISMSRYIPSPIASRRTSDGDRIRLKASIPSTSTRWMTYAKNPSPCPIQRKLSERRASGSEQAATPAANETAAAGAAGSAAAASIAEKRGEESGKEPQWSSQMEQDRQKRDEIAGWQPVRKFTQAVTTSTTTTTVTTATMTSGGPQKPSAQGDQEQSVPDVNRVKQRLRELYDFKTETEWPKRVRNPSRETLWISKSSSEEDKSHQLQPQQQLQQQEQEQQQQQQQQKPEPHWKPVRRNSQDLEFNDRSSSIKSNSHDRSSSIKSDSHDRSSSIKSNSHDRSSSIKSNNHDRSSSMKSISHDRSSSMKSISHDRSSSIKSISHDRSSSIKSNNHDRSSSIKSNNHDRSSSIKSTNHDRSSSIKSISHEQQYPHQQTSSSRRQLPERPPARRQSSNDQVFEPTNADDRRLMRNLQERLRFSEDLGSCSRTDEEKTRGEVAFAKVSRVRDRRTYSDDYEDPSRRKISNSTLMLRENKRNSDSSVSRSSRPSYAEIESTSSMLRNSRTASDASYVSVGSAASLYNPQITKRGSIEFKSNSRRIEVSHRRTMSQYDPRPRTMMSQMEARPTRAASHYEHRPRSGSHYYELGRPRTPVPPPEIEDLYKDFRTTPGKSVAGFPQRQRRNSTRYKVYLT